MDRRRRTTRTPGAGLLRAWVPLVVWLGGLSVGVALFHALGSGPLAAPPVTEPGAWGAWATERDPAVATVAVLRLVVLGLAWYLVGVTTVGIVARLARLASLVRLADALTVPVVRRFLQGALGLGLATAMVAAAAPGVHRPSADEVRLVGVPADEAPADEARLVRAPADEVRLVRAAADEAELARVAGPLPLELLEGDEGEDEVTMRQVVEGDAEEGDGEEGEGDGAHRELRHQVVAGESLWTIARDALASAAGEVPADETLHGYWLGLIEHNRARLADPDNPDLIFPGQQLELPPLPGGAGGAAGSGS